MVNAYQLDDLVGHYIGDYKFKLKDKVLEVNVKDVGYILRIPFTSVCISIQCQDEVRYGIGFWKTFLMTLTFLGMFPIFTRMIY